MTRLAERAVISPAQLGDRAEFDSLGARIYLNHAAISPPSARVKSLMHDALESFATQGSGAFLEWVEDRVTLKARLAKLLGAPSRDGSDFAWMPNTTSGIQAIAHAFPWRSGDRVLLFEGEFPTNIIPWSQAAARSDLTLRWSSLDPLMAEGGADWSAVERELRAGIRLVAVSAVQFQTGLRVPLDELSALCKRYGAALCVDGIQACGAVPIPLDEIDFLACGGHKWMMALEGAGFLFVHPRWRDRLKPQCAGWLSVEEPLDFLFAPRSSLRYDKTIRAEVSAFEGGAQSAVCYAALSASVSALEELSVARIHHHVQALLDPLEEQLLALGMRCARLSDSARRSCILSARPHPNDSRDVTSWAEDLLEAGIVAATPDGWLRFSPHWPNHTSEIERTCSVLTQLSRGQMSARARSTSHL